MTTLFWFRNDLRLSDNEALVEAARASDDLVPIFILDDTVARPLGGAQRWWLHHSLTALSDALKKKGVTLVLKKGDSQKTLLALVKKYKVEAVYWSRVYEPDALKRDKVIERELKKHCDTHVFNGSLLTEPTRIKNKSGGFFKVYTPYWRALCASLRPQKLISAPRKLSQQSKVASDRLSAWKLLPTKPDWTGGFDIWQPGEAGAQKALKRFLKDGLKDYANDRNRPDLLGTSHLSPHLHFGELSPWQVWNAVKQMEVGQAVYRKGAEVFLKQIVWREFSYYLLFHYPQMPKKNFNEKFDRFKWIKSKKLLRAWQKGLTGYPIVDAGMRELWATGYMHNRVRMIAASFLTKDLLIHWREGEKWFWDTLLDADLANNVAGWQWVAGSGADAAPYFRIFNPTLQGIKFDPHGDYVRRWIPELAEVPDKFIHEPTKAPEKPEGYRDPIVDHSKARDEALRRYKEVK